MKLLPFILPLLLAVPASGQGYPKSCDSCEDLPALMKELKEQEWLRSRFYSFSPWEKVYPFTAGSVKDLQTRVKAAFDAWLKTPQGGGGAGEPTMGTNSEDCKLVFFVKDAEGKIIATFTSIWRMDAAGNWKIIFDKGNNACNCTTQ